jgi:hypothetical protein
MQIVGERRNIQNIAKTVSIILSVKFHKMPNVASEIWKSLQKHNGVWQAIGNAGYHNQSDSNTTTAKGLVIKCGLDSDEYKTGRKVTDEELGQANIIRSEFRGDWNYVIAPVETYQ